MNFDVIDAEYLGDYRIRITFRDGSTGIADLADYPDRNNVFHLFFDINYFKRFRVDCGTLVWGEGEVDLAPEKLYELATGMSIEYPAPRPHIMKISNQSADACYRKAKDVVMMRPFDLVESEDLCN